MDLCWSSGKELKLSCKQISLTIYLWHAGKMQYDVQVAAEMVTFLWHSLSWTDNHLCSWGWAGFGWSPVAYLLLLRTRKTVPRQHAQERKGKKENKNKNVPLYNKTAFNLQELVLRKKWTLRDGTIYSYEPFALVAISCWNYC